MQQFSGVFTLTTLLFITEGINCQATSNAVANANSGDTITFMGPLPIGNLMSKPEFIPNLFNDILGFDPPKQQQQQPVPEQNVQGPPKDGPGPQRRRRKRPNGPKNGPKNGPMNGPMNGPNRPRRRMRPRGQMGQNPNGQGPPPMYGPAPNLDYGVNENPRRGGRPGPSYPAHTGTDTFAGGPNSMANANANAMAGGPNSMANADANAIASRGGLNSMASANANAIAGRGGPNSMANANANAMAGRGGPNSMANADANAIANRGGPNSMANANANAMAGGGRANAQAKALSGYNSPEAEVYDEPDSQMEQLYPVAFRMANDPNNNTSDTEIRAGIYSVSSSSISPNNTETYKASAGKINVQK